MKYRPFGKTGLQVSEVVFGGGNVGGIVIHADDDTRRTAIRRALDGGINWIDTATQYGQGRSEEALGWLLNEIDDTPYVSTKVKLDPARLDDIPGQIEESLTASLTRLQRDSVDLLQLHNHIEPEIDGTDISLAEVLGKNGVADGLERVREQGLTRFIGLTAIGDAATCCAAIESGRFDSAQVYYNLLNPSAAMPVPAHWSGHDFSGIIAACNKADMAVMAIRVFAAGVVATDDRHGREAVLTRGSEIGTEELRAAAAFNALGLEDDGNTQYGTRAQTGLRFALSQPGISCAIVGLAELEHLDQALAAAEMGPLPPEAVDRLKPLYERDFA